MKDKNENTSRLFALVLSLVFAAAPQFTLMRQVAAQDPNGISMPTLQLRDLGIDNEARKIVSLVGTHVKFFKRGSDLQQKGIVSPRDATDFKNEGDLRKADLLTTKRELESLISKLKQGNHWDAAFDAQFLASLKNTSARSLVAQAGGARKLFEAAIGEFNLVRQDIDDEVLQVNSKQTRALRNRNDRAFAAHARPPVGKVGCNLLLTSFAIADVAGAAIACAIADRYNQKGCSPKVACSN